MHRTVSSKWLYPSKTIEWWLTISNQWFVTVILIYKTLRNRFTKTNTLQRQREMKHGKTINFCQLFSNGFMILSTNINPNNQYYGKQHYRNNFVLKLHTRTSNILLLKLVKKQDLAKFSLAPFGWNFWGS